jgi:replication-associated recombination protein RarA
MKTAIKYAPRNLSEIIYPSTAVERRIMGYASGQLEGHILMHGSNGTGKTSIANLLPIAIAGEDAAIDENDYDAVLGQKDIRKYLKNACHLSKLNGSGKHFMVFNEFDNAKVHLSKLWTAMDACGDILMVIITTNEPMNVHKSIRSRCDLIEISAMKARTALARSQQILRAEGLNLPDAQVLHYLKTREYAGDLRKYMGLLDEILFLHASGEQLPAWTAPQPPLLVAV